MPPQEKRTFSIKNKLARQRFNVKIKTCSSGDKHKFRAQRRKDEEKNPELRVERLKKNIPVTLDRARVWDERAAHEAAMQARAEAAEAALLYPTLPSISALTASTPTSTISPEPKLLITTSRNSHMHSPAHELATIFPNSTYIPRGRPQNCARKGAKTKPKQFSIPEICSFASAPPASASGEPTTPYTHVAVINEHRKKPSGLTVIVLPLGPSFHFSLTNYIPSNRLHNHGRATSHTPELILNNFLTPLGKLAAGLFQSMFPSVPELGGRQVVTLHNQRDYIFFRRHRYIDLGVKVGLQELGPQFTLKLRKVEKGVCEGVEWQWKGEMEKERRKFQL
ncbi:Brix-domain-containing protein [Terfezia boudieri ATCC MYA-4762]|uniref:Brix-domain-containing protein n=1 Tax=Terfezia boudieri ATCC MYA-4762 TaxID=1051890 RepID=A0A3N4LQA8_9PEZI|nr:Brix-domain-containing protein [Terfezia boudieri ATCC MYA-4762]